MTNLALAMLVVTAAGASERIDVQSDRPDIIKETWGKTAVTVEIHARQWRTKDFVGEASAEWAFGQTVTVIYSLEIKYGSRPLFVPRSSFADLLNVRTAELRVRRDIATLVVRGGDASTSFEAHIEFDAVRVKRRRLVSPVVAEDGPVEETVYFRRVLKDEPAEPKPGSRP